MKTDTHFDAVLFDLDGTLLDTIEDLSRSMNATLAEDGLPTVPVERQRLMVGGGVRTYVLRALPEERRGDEAYLEDFTRRFRARYARNWAESTRPYPGIPGLLKELAARGLALAVLSNKPDPATREMVRYFFPEVDFAVVRGAVDGAPIKPDPAPALAIAEKMGLPPHRFLYLGDTAVDIHTARAAGMYPVGVLWGFRSREELAAAGASSLIERPGELLPLLSGTRPDARPSTSGE